MERIKHDDKTKRNHIIGNIKKAKYSPKKAVTKKY